MQANDLHKLRRSTMKTAAIIAEYNPFHNGHKYQIEETRRRTGADFIAVVMSGDFVQRGAPAIYSKFLRTRSALLSGADLVVEMPVFGSLSAAQDFARCGISLFHHMGIIDVLSFGSEAGEIKKLQELADQAGTETEEQSDLIRKSLRSGLTYPQALALARKDSVPVSPNDILAVEYLKALKEFSSAVEPWTLKRSDPGYHSEGRDGSFASATAIRKAISAQDPDFLSAVLPNSHFESLQAESEVPLFPDDFSLLIEQKILTSAPEKIQSISGMPEGLAAKLCKNRLEFLRTDALTAARKDRQYTYAKVSRALMNLMLDITDKDQRGFAACDYAPWVRILGFRKTSAALLSELKKHCDIPVIVKTADAKEILSPEVYPLFEKNLTASEICRMVRELKSGKVQKNEFTRSPIRIP